MSLKSYSLFSLLLLLVCLSGCGFTQLGVFEKLSPQISQRLEAQYAAQQSIIDSLILGLSEIDRGGMTVEIDQETGKVRAVSYTQPLDMSPLYAVAKVPVYKPPVIRSIAGEFFDGVAKIGGPLTAGLSIYYGHKNFVAGQDAQVSMNASNNAADAAMWGNFTDSFQNYVETNTSVTDLTDIQDYSVTEVTDISDTSVTEVTDISDTTVERYEDNTTVDSSNNATSADNGTISY